MDYGKLRVGERILCESEGIFYEAKILEKEENEFLVHYQGWHKRYDEWIEKDDLDTRVKPFSQEELNETKRKLAEKKAEEKQARLDAEAAKLASANEATTPGPYSRPQPQTEPRVVFKARSPPKEGATTAPRLPGLFNGSKLMAKLTLPIPLPQAKPGVRTMMIAPNGDLRKRKFDAVSSPSYVPVKGITFVSARSGMMNQQHTPQRAYTIKRPPMSMCPLPASIQNNGRLAQQPVKLYAINQSAILESSNAMPWSSNRSTNPPMNVKIFSVSRAKDPESRTKDPESGTKDSAPEPPKAIKEEACSCGIPGCLIVTPYDEWDQPAEAPEPEKSEPLQEASPSKFALPFHCGACGLAFDTKVHLDLHKLFTESCQEKAKGEGSEDEERSEVEEPSTSKIQNAPAAPSAKNVVENTTQAASTQLMNKLKENPTRPIYIRSKNSEVPKDRPSAAASPVPGRKTPVLQQAPHFSKAPKTTSITQNVTGLTPHSSLYCTICKRIFSSAATRNHHMQTAHMAWCHQCKRTISQLFYAKHMETYHPTTSGTPPPGPMRAIFKRSCTECGHTFYSRDSYNAHVPECTAKPRPTLNTMTSMNTMRSRTAPIKQKTPQSPNACSYCPVVCEDSATLAVHILMHFQNTAAPSTSA